MIKSILFAVFLLATPFVQAHQISNFQTVHANAMYRGGRPSVQDLKDLKAMGIQTILNLENDANAVAKEKDVALALRFNYISMPTASWSQPKDSAVDKILEILNDPKSYPIFIHCTHGRDRTGLMVGLYRVEKELWTPKAAYQEMRHLGFRPLLFNLDRYFKNRTRL